MAGLDASWSYGVQRSQGLTLGLGQKHCFDLHKSTCLIFERGNTTQDAYAKLGEGLRDGPMRTHPNMSIQVSLCSNKDTVFYADTYKYVNGIRFFLSSCVSLCYCLSNFLNRSSMGSPLRRCARGQLHGQKVCSLIGEQRKGLRTFH